MQTGQPDEKHANGGRRRIAIVGTGISGLSAAWLLAQRHDVTVFEAADRIGGHSNTVEFHDGGSSAAVDTGFIVYNEVTYPNLMALFKTLGVATSASNMSFAVSVDQGRFEYAGGRGLGLFAQPGNLVNPRFWSMLRDLLRFYRHAPSEMAAMEDMSLAGYLDRKGYGHAFREDHLYPMAAAIWSMPAGEVGQYPASHFVRFCNNHGLLKLANRPVWRTVSGGSREYVSKLSAPFADRIRLSTPIREIRRLADGVEISDGRSGFERFDDVVIAAHGDQALAMLSDASIEEKEILGAFRYSRNEAVLHRDEQFMPKRRAAWASWNYLGDSRSPSARPAITYWMNRLQTLTCRSDIFVTLNPARQPREDRVIRREMYEHPIFDMGTEQAQKRIWSLQGRRHTWFCGAHFGSGFHEDGLQAGLAVAEDLGGLKRPWSVAEESGRIVRQPVPSAVPKPMEVYA